MMEVDTLIQICTLFVAAALEIEVNVSRDSP